MNKFISVVGLILLSAVLASGWVATVSAEEPGDKVPKYKVVDETVVIEQVSSKARGIHWIYVDCDYWAGCYVRCDGTRDACRKVIDSVPFQIHFINSSQL